MLEIEINNEKFELTTNIGTIKRIESQFNHEAFVSLINRFQDMKTQELITLLGCGLKDKDERKKMSELIEENWGFGDLVDVLDIFIQKLQYPGKTEKEIAEKNEGKLAQFKEMKEAGLIQ